MELHGRYELEYASVKLEVSVIARIFSEAPTSGIIIILTRITPKNTLFFFRVHIPTHDKIPIKFSFITNKFFRQSRPLS